jgi:hypothetical protein
LPIDITSEPSGAAYQQLIAAAKDQCDTFSLVWRDGESVNPDVAEALAAHLLREERINRWPGTRLHDHLATVRFYRLSDISAAVLEKAGSLFAWQHPDLPEDLAFYGPDGQCWMGSIAHEADAWFDGNLSLSFIERRMPALRVQPP